MCSQSLKKYLKGGSKCQRRTQSAHLIFQNSSNATKEKQHKQSSGVQSINNVYHIVDKVENVLVYTYIFILIDNVEYVVYALYSRVLRRWNQFEQNNFIDSLGLGRDRDSKPPLSALKPSEWSTTSTLGAFKKILMNFCFNRRS